MTLQPCAQKQKTLDVLRRVSSSVLFLAKPENKPVALPKGAYNFVLKWMLWLECSVICILGGSSTDAAGNTMRCLLKVWRDYLCSCSLVAVLISLRISCHQKLQDAVQNLSLKLGVSSCSFLVLFSV